MEKASHGGWRESSGALAPWLYSLGTLLSTVSKVTAKGSSRFMRIAFRNCHCLDR